MSSLACIKQFATCHNLRVVTDKGDGTSIIDGKYGHLYEYDENRLAVIYLSDSVGKANNRRKACAAVGMEITQDGATEFAAAFDPQQKKQVKLAIKVSGAKTKRVLSPEQRQRASEVLKTYRDRLKPCQNDVLAA